jgi:rhodanese-related sulfurtransferase
LIRNIIFITFGLTLFSQLTFADIQKVNTGNLKNLILDGVPIIDIRTPKEWIETGIIEGSHLITFFNKKGEVNLGQWLFEFDKIADKQKPFILICRSGRRTGVVSKYLDKNFDFFKIYDATDGINGWKKSNKLSPQLSN